MRLAEYHYNGETTLDEFIKKVYNLPIIIIRLPKDAIVTLLQLLPDDCILLRTLCYIESNYNNIEYSIDDLDLFNKFALFDKLKSSIFKFITTDYNEIMKIPKNKSIPVRELYFPECITLSHSDRAVHYNISNDMMAPIPCNHMTIRINRNTASHERSDHIYDEHLLCITVLYRKMRYLEIICEIIYEDDYHTFPEKAYYNKNLNLPYAMTMCKFTGIFKTNKNIVLKLPYKCKSQF